MKNTFKLHSGERQVGTTLRDIRADHIDRYKISSKYLISGTSNTLNGLDVFCGNGYGSFLLSESLGCNMTGIDASADAIVQARQYFSNDKTFFIVKEFPFFLPYKCYDFITSMESIEHVKNTELLLENLIHALKPVGYLFLSAPNSKELSLEKNPNKFHFRHFSFNDILSLVSGIDSTMKLIDFYGQNAYTMLDGKVTGYLPNTEMGLIPNNSKGQFLYYVFKKSNES